MLSAATQLFFLFMILLKGGAMQWLLKADAKPVKSSEAVKAETAIEPVARLLFDPREGLLKKRPNRTTDQSMHGGIASIIVERSSLHLVVPSHNLSGRLPRWRKWNSGGAASIVDGNQWIDFACSIARPVELYRWPCFLRSMKYLMLRG